MRFYHKRMTANPGKENKAKIRQHRTDQRIAWRHPAFQVITMADIQSIVTTIRLPEIRKQVINP